MNYVDKLDQKVNLTPLWQWPAILLSVALANNLDAFIDPETVYIKLLYGSLSMFLMWAGPAYFVKFFRYRADIWQGKGMIRRDMDSGAKMAARVYLGRERPHFLVAPLSHLFLKWNFLVGEICMNTGSVSVYKAFVTNLVQEEKQCRAIGTNDAITGEAAAHIYELLHRLGCGTNLHQVNIFNTIEALRDSGLKIQENVAR